MPAQLDTQALRIQMCECMRMCVQACCCRTRGLSSLVTQRHCQCRYILVALLPTSRAHQLGPLHSTGAVLDSTTTQQHTHPKKHSGYELWQSNFAQGRRSFQQRLVRLYEPNIAYEATGLYTQRPGELRGFRLGGGQVLASASAHSRSFFLVGSLLLWL